MKRLLARILIIMFMIVSFTTSNTALAKSAAEPPIIIIPPLPIDPGIFNIKLEYVAFSAVPNRYTNMDPSINIDFNGDLMGDISLLNSTVTGKNGTQVMLLNSGTQDFKEVVSVPAGGYVDSTQAQLYKVYIAKLPTGAYTKFVLHQVSPKITIEFATGNVTTSLLKADGSGGHVVLSWDPLSDAALGYNIYRYEFLDNNSYSVTILNDFVVKQTNFTDNTALNRSYIYIVTAVKSNGATGSLTTNASVQVKTIQHSLVISLDKTEAKLDGKTVNLTGKPVIKNGRLMLPATCFTNAGVKVNYDSTSQKLTMTRVVSGITYTTIMTRDLPDYIWNGASYRADVPPFKSGNDIYVSLRIAAPILGLGASFNSITNEATISWFE